MRAILKLLCGLLSALGLSACDTFVIDQIKPGVTTAHEVRELLGPPGIEWRNEDGSRTLEYSRQPEGVHCYMITIGSDDVVHSVEQVITEANLARVQPGWTQEQVRRLLGMRRSVEYFELKNEEVWDWKIPGDHVEEELFNVHFDPQGIVVRTSRGIIPLP